MCVAITKPIGVAVPTKKQLKNCFNKNPHGAGFAFVSGGKVYIEKGFMTFKAFMRAFNSFGFTKEDALLIHFRITTHGGTTQGNTHPFPYTSSFEKMHKVSSSCDVAMIHNGILDITPEQADVSDTMQFMQYLVLNDIDHENPFTQTLIESFITGSKVAFLKSDGEITKLGNGWKDVKGVGYSNESYKDPIRTYYNNYYGQTFENGRWTNKNEKGQNSTPVTPYKVVDTQKKLTVSEWSAYTVVCLSKDNHDIVYNFGYCPICGSQVHEVTRNNSEVPLTRYFDTKQHTATVCTHCEYAFIAIDTSKINRHEICGECPNRCPAIGFSKESGAIKQLSTASAYYLDDEFNLLLVKKCWTCNDLFIPHAKSKPVVSTKTQSLKRVSK